MFLVPFEDFSLDFFLGFSTCLNFNFLFTQANPRWQMYRCHLCVLGRHYTSIRHCFTAVSPLCTWATLHEHQALFYCIVTFVYLGDITRALGIVSQFNNKLPQLKTECKVNTLYVSPTSACSPASRGGGGGGGVLPVLG